VFTNRVGSNFSIKLFSDYLKLISNLKRVATLPCEILFTAFECCYLQTVRFWIL